MIEGTRLRQRIIALTIGLVCAAAFDPAIAASVQQNAVQVASPTIVPILAAVRAGSRIVTVGEHGVILLSDDDGKSFRQARQVPTQALLTSLTFVDAQHGWAAGHDGVVVVTADGGETWTLQREDVDGDRPLFSIYFRDAQHGLAVGLFNTAIFTDDGGKTWIRRELRPGQDEDKHLYAIFKGPENSGASNDTLFVAAEAGTIYRSTDAGANWDEIQTADAGSFWAGLALKDGSLLAIGQRGHIFQSHDLGLSWSETPSGTEQSLTDIIELKDGSLLITGLAGVTLSRAADAGAFVVHQRSDRAPLTAAIAAESNDAKNPVRLFGSNGVTDADSPRTDAVPKSPQS